MPTVEVVVLAPDDSRHLLTLGGGTIRFPLRLPSWQMEIGEDERLLPPARRELVSRLGIETPVLEVFLPEGIESMSPAPVLMVLEPVDEGSSEPVDARWRDIRRITSDLLPPALASRAQTWLDELDQRAEVPELRPAWARPGWLARVRTWLDGALEEAGRRRTGPVEQIKLWGISALLRAETDRGSIWVKAAFPPFRAEPVLTRLLAERFPSALPTVLATNDEEGWLAMEDLGDQTAADGGDGSLRAACDLLASIQHAMASETAALFAAGAAVRGLDDLAEGLDDAYFGQPQVVTWEQSVDRRRRILRKVAGQAVDLAAGAPEDHRPLGLPSLECRHDRRAPGDLRLDRHGHRVPADGRHRRGSSARKTGPRANASGRSGWARGRMSSRQNG